jgi:hypothetical protein
MFMINGLILSLRHRRRRMLLTVAGVGLATALALMLGRADGVAPVDRLLAKFDETVFENDYGGRWSRLYKWRGEMRIHPVPPFPPYLRRALGRYIPALRRITGLAIRVADNSADANVHIHYVSSDKFLGIVRAFGFYNWTDMRASAPPACFFSPEMGTYSKSAAVIGIRTGRSEVFDESCLLEELYQGLGIGKNTDIIRPSISSNQDHVTELTLNDKILIRALYDPRFKPGMDYEDVMEIAREVIPTLVARVRDAGESALDHPDWLARRIGSATPSPGQ